MPKSQPAPAPAVPSPPTIVGIDFTPAEICANLRIVDAGTGEPIERVIRADAGAGTVSRYRVEEGNLVREGDLFATVDEERAIRIEWIDPPVAAYVPADAAINPEAEG